MTDRLRGRGAPRAHLHLAEEGAVELAPASFLRRALAIGLALAVVVAMPLLWTQSAFGHEGPGEDGSGVVQGSSGPGSGTEEDDDDADDEPEGDGDDDVTTAGTSARGEETAGTTGIEESTGTAGTSVKLADDTGGTSNGGESTGTNGTSARGVSESGTSADGESTGTNGTSAAGETTAGTSGAEEESTVA